MQDTNMKRMIIIIAVLLVISAIIAIPFIKMAQQSDRYDAARALMGDGEYQAAIEQFSAFDAEYRSTESLLHTCRVSLRAQALLDEGKVDEALALCEAEGIENTSMWWQCSFDAALRAFDRLKAEGDYQGAKDALGELDDANDIVAKLTDDELDAMRDELDEMRDELEADRRLNDALEEGNYWELFTIYAEQDDMDGFDELRLNKGTFSRSDIVKRYLEEQGDAQRARKWADAAFALKAYSDAFDAYILLEDYDQALLAVQADGSFRLHVEAVSRFEENGDTVMLEKALASALENGLHSYIFSYYVDHDELQKAEELLALWMNQPEPVWDSSAHFAARDLDMQSYKGIQGASHLRQALFDQFEAVALSDVKMGKREKAYLLCDELAKDFGDGFDAQIETIRKSCTFAFPATGVMERSDSVAGEGVTLHIYNKSASKGAIVYMQGFLSHSNTFVFIRVFLRPNDNHTVTFLPGDYSASVAVGSVWFGEEERFGEKSGSYIGVDIQKSGQIGVQSHSDSSVYMEGEYSLTIPR